MHAIIHCRRPASALLIVSALLAGSASLAWAEGSESYAIDGIETAANTLARHSVLPPPPPAKPAEAIIPAVRTIDAEAAISGSETDPETFDRRGFEIWWRDHETTYGDPK
jgi:hypothetical protein